MPRIIIKVIQSDLTLTCKRSCFVNTIIVLTLLISNTYSSDNLQNQFRSSLSSVSLLHAVSSNPALLASPGYPTFGLQLPIPAPLTLQITNSTLTLPNPFELFINGGHIDQWIARMLIESFQLDGLSSKEVSERLSAFADKDIELWMYAEIAFLKIAHKKGAPSNFGWGFDISSFIDGYVNIPGQFFALVFSTEKGLQPGNQISFESLRACSEFVTELKSAWAHSFDISIGRRDRELFNKALLGFGLTQRFGHAYYSLTADTLMLDYRNRGIMNVREDLSITTSGMREDGSIDGLNINGYGLEISFGSILQNDYVSISGSFNNLGFMGWFNKNYLTNMYVARDSVFLYDMFGNENDSLIIINSRVPRRIRYFLSPVLSGLVSTRIPIKERTHALCTYQLFSLGCQLSSTRIGTFGRGYVFSFDMESGVDYGKIPLRVGWTYAENNNISSTISIELVNSQLTYDIWYRASGDWLFRSKKGAEFGFCFHIFSGFKPGFRPSFR